MSDSNKHGLSRHIPQFLKREIRQRSKFGCVICRNGLVVYEHIAPPFAEATEHNPDHICCLCSSCHDLVTRGQYSKELVVSKYAEISSARPDQVPCPIVPMDFHDGSAQLSIGGFNFEESLPTILRYHEHSLISVTPSDGKSGPGKIEAVFTDEKGRIILELRDQEWIGSVDAWDIESTGNRLRVSGGPGCTSLDLRFNPPGKVEVEKLDMRLGNFHFLASNKSWAVGRCISGGKYLWIHANISVHGPTPVSAMFDLQSPEELKARDEKFAKIGHSLAPPGRKIVLSGSMGCMWVEEGVAIGSFFKSMSLRSVVSVVAPLDVVREAVSTLRSEELVNFLGEITRKGR